MILFKLHAFDKCMRQQGPWIHEILAQYKFSLDIIKTESALTVGRKRSKDLEQVHAVKLFFIGYEDIFLS